MKAPLLVSTVVELRVGVPLRMMVMVGLQVRERPATYCLVLGHDVFSEGALSKSQLQSAWLCI